MPCPLSKPSQLKHLKVKAAICVGHLYLYPALDTVNGIVDVGHACANRILDSSIVTPTGKPATDMAPVKVSLIHQKLKKVEEVVLPLM